MSACGLLELRKTVIEKTFTILFHKPHVKFHKMKQSKNLTEAKWRLGLKICEGRRAYGLCGNSERNYRNGNYR